MSLSTSSREIGEKEEKENALGGGLIRKMLNLGIGYFNLCDSLNLIIYMAKCFSINELD